MAKYFKSSEYYPDDKDIYDFLDSQTRSNAPLLSFLRSRSIFASKESQKEELQNYISLLFFDWDSANSLVDIVDLRDNAEKVKNSKYSIDADTSVVHAMATSVKNMRHEARREVYNISQNGDDVDINVTYLDIDTSKTRVLQKREKVLKITAMKEDGNWSFRYTDNERSKKILDTLVKKLKESTEQSTVKERHIDISHIKDHSERVSFFKDMMSEIEGFRLITATNLKVDRIPNELNDDDSNQDDDILIDEKLKKVVMYGADLFTAPAFQEFVDQGFFISGAQWKSEKTDGRGEQVEFSANFKSAEGKDFVYKILGVYRVDDGGSLLKTREKVYGHEKKEYQSAIENSAHSSLDKVNGDSNESA